MEVRRGEVRRGEGRRGEEEFVCVNVDRGIIGERGRRGGGIILRIYDDTKDQRHKDRERKRKRWTKERKRKR